MAFPVFNGTGANVVALQALLPRWGAVVCAETAHINTDEGGAPERMGGIKLLTVPTPDGKLTPELIDRQAWGFGDEHRAQPLVVSITQTTELGTCYTPEEVRAISDHAHALGMRVHLDGARISNAAATLGTDLSAFTGEAGVDVVSLGGTKNGALAAEAVVVVEPRAGRRPVPRARPPAQAVDAAGLQDALRVGAAHRALRQRPVAALGHARQRDGGPARGGRRAAARRRRSSARCRPTPSSRCSTDDVANALRERFRFYDWDPATGEVRWMCSWDTTEADVDAFLAELRTAPRRLRAPLRQHEPAPRRGAGLCPVDETRQAGAVVKRR